MYFVVKSEANSGDRAHVITYATIPAVNDWPGPAPCQARVWDWWFTELTHGEYRITRWWSRP